MTIGKIIKTAAAACLMLMGSVAFAAAGDFDPSFNGLGFTRDFIPDLSGTSGVAIHSTGEIVTSGFYLDLSISTEYLVVWRHLPDGSLDGTFGSGGVAYPTPSPAGVVGPVTEVAVDNQDRIVLVAVTANSHVVFRLNFDGSPDLGFAGTGSMTVPLGSVYPITGVAIQPDDKIVAVSGASASTSQFTVYRVQESGGLDPDFGGTGIVMTQITPGGGVDRATGVAIQPDGNIVVAGRAHSLDAGSFYKFALARYSPAGVLDDSFGDGGKVVFPLLDNSYGRKVVIQPDGKIVIAGSTCIGPTDAYCYLAAARVDEAGALDASFGNGGKVYTDVGNHGGLGFDVALQSDGRILVAGEHQWTADRIQGSGENGILIRYLPDGSLDPVFGSNGISETNYGYVQQEISTVRVQADGQIVVSAFTGNAVSESAVTARYLASGGSFAAIAGSGAPQAPKSLQVER